MNNVSIKSDEKGQVKATIDGEEVTVEMALAALRSGSGYIYSGPLQVAQVTRMEYKWHTAMDFLTHVSDTEGQFVPIDFAPGNLVRTIQRIWDAARELVPQSPSIYANELALVEVKAYPTQSGPEDKTPQ